MRAEPARRGRWLQLAGAVLVALAVVGVVTHGRKAQAATTPSAMVTPNTGLTDPTNGNPGDPVTIVATGFPATTQLIAEECSGTHSNPPTDNSSCDGVTESESSPTNSSGDVTFTDVVFMLPDSSPAFRTPPIDCDVNNPCVLYVGADPTDFTQPKVFVDLGFAGASPTTTTTSTTTTTTTTIPTTTTSTSVPTTSSTTATTTSSTTSSTTSTTAPLLGSATASVGSQVTITGSNFGAGATVTFALDNSANLGTTTAGSDGSFSFTFTVAASVTIGQHVITASSPSGMVATFDLTVVASNGCSSATSSSSTASTTSTTICTTTTASSSSSDTTAGSGLPVTGWPLGSPVLAIVGVGAILAGTDLRHRAVRR